MAQNIMLTAFRWLKTLCEQSFDGPKQDVNKVSMAQTLFKQRLDGSTIT